MVESSGADNAEHVTVNEEEGFNATEIEDNAAVVNNLTITAISATALIANLDIDDNNETENVDSKKYYDNFSVPGIQHKYHNTRERTTRQEYGQALKRHARCAFFSIARQSAVMWELHSDTPIGKHQIEEKVPSERAYDASAHGAVDGSN